MLLNCYFTFDLTAIGVPSSRVVDNQNEAIRVYLVLYLEQKYIYKKTLIH